MRQQLEFVEVLHLDADPDQQVTVAYNPEIAKHASAYRDSLYATRKLNDEQSVTGAHPSVLQLKVAGVPIKEGIDIVRQSMQSYRLAALDAALKAAMLGEMFEQRLNAGMVIVTPKFPAELTPDWWNDDEENERRVLSWVAPLPKRNPSHPIEQRAAYIHALLRENPLLSFRFGNLFTDAANDLIDQSVEVADRDPAGFQS